jgi:hypothetical protein
VAWHLPDFHDPHTETYRRPLLLLRGTGNHSHLKALFTMPGINSDNSSPLADCNSRGAFTFAIMIHL